MKKLFALLLTLMLLPVFALAEEADSMPANAPIAVADGATITVTGSASMSLKADYARVSVGVSTQAATVEAAAQENNVLIHAVIDALKAVGIAETDIVTNSYSVYAQYDYSSFSGEEKLVGYKVTNQLSVILRDMAHIGATLDKATTAGANSIYNIEFLSTKADEAQDEAMTYAVQDAIRRAKLLASAAGLELGGIVSISDSTSGWLVSSRTYESAMDKAATSNVILPDDASVNASVTMVFELK